MPGGAPGRRAAVRAARGPVRDSGRSSAAAWSPALRFDAAHPGVWRTLYAAVRADGRRGVRVRSDLRHGAASRFERGTDFELATVRPHRRSVVLALSVAAAVSDVAQYDVDRAVAREPHVRVSGVLILVSRHRT